MCPQIEPAGLIPVGIGMIVHRMYEKGSAEVYTSSHGKHCCATPSDDCFDIMAHIEAPITSIGSSISRVPLTICSNGEPIRLWFCCAAWMWIFKIEFRRSLSCSVELGAVHRCSFSCRLSKCSSKDQSMCLRRNRKAY